MKISANLGFLFTERKLPDAIRAAADAGFDAVECHWPFDIPASETLASLQDTGLEMLGLNTLRGDHLAGENGLAAVAGREKEARDRIDQALGYAAATNTSAVHVMAGYGGAFDTFVDNLRYACEKAARQNCTILIEPLNRRDAPDYFLSDTHMAERLIEAVGADNLKIMFDCYHLQIMQGDLLVLATRLMPKIGHIQFAAVHDRGEPDAGEIDYRWLLPRLVDAGFQGSFGAEYKPRGGNAEAGPGWLQEFRAL
ncbi:MAG: hydroxypyruvate isomerase family protein [Paracoccaceae bacterium]